MFFRRIRRKALVYPKHNLICNVSISVARVLRPKMLNKAHLLPAPSSSPAVPSPRQSLNSAGAPLPRQRCNSAIRPRVLQYHLPKQRLTRVCRVSGRNPAALSARQPPQRGLGLLGLGRRPVHRALNNAWPRHHQARIHLASGGRPGPADPHGDRKFPSIWTSSRPRPGASRYAPSSARNSPRGGHNRTAPARFSWCGNIRSPPPP